MRSNQQNKQNHQSNLKDKLGYIREAYEYAKNQAKWKMAKEFCADRKWEFKVVTEKELGI